MFMWPVLKFLIYFPQVTNIPKDSTRRTGGFFLLSVFFCHGSKRTKINFQNEMIDYRIREDTVVPLPLPDPPRILGRGNNCILASTVKQRIIFGVLMCLGAAPMDWSTFFFNNTGSKIRRAVEPPKNEKKKTNFNPSLIFCQNLQGGR